jgi:arsenite oxidase large subunit
VRGSIFDPGDISHGCDYAGERCRCRHVSVTSMNGERRMRLTERYMDPPGQAMPDCLIAARIANHMERVLREQGSNKRADDFKGFDWKTEEDAFMDGYAKHEKGGEFVTYARLRAMGTNGFQEPAVDFKDGKILFSVCLMMKLVGKPDAGNRHVRFDIGTKRLFADGNFGSKDGKATFMETKWRGLQAEGKEAEKNKWPFLINNGRTNHVWQSAYLDQQNDFVMDRWPYPFIQMHPGRTGGERRRSRRGLQRQRLNAGRRLSDAGR